MIPRVAYQFLRFAGIGFLNTAVDFAVFNLLANNFQAYVGIPAGVIKVVSFIVAVVHSYYWNKYWAFGVESEQEGAAKNLGQFVSAAILGGAVAGVIIIGSGFGSGIVFYLIMLAALIIGEVWLWKYFKLQRNILAKKSRREFTLFIAVSIIGALINAGIVVGVTKTVPPLFGIPQEFWTNLIVAGAIGISLIWNFVGYKIFVFKR